MRNGNKREIIFKPKYSQPHNIHLPISCCNEAFEKRMIEYLHARAKYAAKYIHPKQSKRNY